MKKFFAKMFAVFRKVFTPTTLALIERGLGNTVPYISEAIQIVTWIAQMAGKRTPEQIEATAAYAKVAMPDWLKSAPNHEALSYIAEQMLKERFPEAELRHIRRAIEIAYGAVKP